jgi:hypothetical protein
MTSPTRSRHGCENGSALSTHKSVLLRLTVRPAGRRCLCRHDPRHVILKDELRFVVQEPGAASREYGYCVHCAKKMLKQAATRLEEIYDELGAQ